jgi:FMN-dependent NADH-azoreductase
MKVVILDGTHSKNGMTQKLVASFLKGVRSEKSNIKVKTYDLLSENIHFCKGCNTCTKDPDPINATCVIQDDVPKIQDASLSADVVVFATPIYEFCVSSTMKRFLERCLTLVSFRFGIMSRAKPIPKRHAILLSASGAPFPINHLTGMTRYPRFIFRLAARLFRCSDRKRILAGGMSFNEKTQKKYERKAYQLGVRIGKEVT